MAQTRVTWLSGNEPLAGSYLIVSETSHGVHPCHLIGRGNVLQWYEGATEPSRLREADELLEIVGGTGRCTLVYFVLHLPS